MDMTSLRYGRDQSEIVTCLTLTQIRCFKNFNRDLFLGLLWVFKSTNISLREICMVRLRY